MTNRLVRISEVLARTGLSRSTLYRLEAEGSFPKRVKLGARSVAWPEALIFEWIDTRANKGNHDVA